jgi:hypothetical protein
VNFKDLVPEEEKEEEKEKDTGKDEENTEDSKDSEEATDDEKKASDEASESNDTETDSKKDSEAKDTAEDEKDKEKKKDIEKKIPTNGERRTSFSFMRVKADEARKEEWDGTDPQDDDYSDDLYDPNKVPRFWKRYLLGKKLDDGEEEDVSDALNEEEDDELPDSLLELLPLLLSLASLTTLPFSSVALVALTPSPLEEPVATVLEGLVAPTEFLVKTCVVPVLELELALPPQPASTAHMVAARAPIKIMDKTFFMCNPLSENSSCI